MTQNAFTDLPGAAAENINRFNRSYEENVDEKKMCILLIYVSWRYAWRDRGDHDSVW